MKMCILSRAPFPDGSNRGDAPYIGGMSEKVIRLVSYNNRKARGLDQQFDPVRILSVINGLGADVIALQEADHRLGDRPAPETPDLASITIESRCASPSWRTGARARIDAVG